MITPRGKRRIDGAGATDFNRSTSMEEIVAKGQKKSGREAKKPKKSALEKAKPGAAPTFGQSAKTAPYTYEKKK
jgi:hypothetical protein